MDEDSAGVVRWLVMIAVKCGDAVDEWFCWRAGAMITAVELSRQLLTQWYDEGAKWFGWPNLTLERMSYSW